MGTSASRRGQALVEAALGMFALALVLTALFGFASCMVLSLDMRRSLRAHAGRAALASAGMPGDLVTAKGSVTVRVESFSAEHVFGKTEVRLQEDVALPPMAVW